MLALGIRFIRAKQGMALEACRGYSTPCDAAWTPDTAPGAGMDSFPHGPMVTLLQVCARGPEDRALDTLCYQWLDENDVFPFSRAHGTWPFDVKARSRRASALALPPLSVARWHVHSFVLVIFACVLGKESLVTF